MTHPIQPLADDGTGVTRFKANAIVRYLLEKGPFDMNHLACQGFSKEDQIQFAQLIGYSLCGFGDLSYVDNDTYQAAVAMAETTELTPEQAKLLTATETLNTLRVTMRDPIATLYGIHPDDLFASAEDL